MERLPPLGELAAPERTASAEKRERIKAALSGVALSAFGLATSLLMHGFVLHLGLCDAIMISLECVDLAVVPFNRQAPPRMTRMMRVNLKCGAKSTITT